MENEEPLIHDLKKELPIPFAEKVSLHEIKEKLAEHINELINNHFDELVGLLYRIDVNENKLRQVLKDHAEKDAAAIIAELIIERQLQKIKSRQQFRKQDEEGTGNEERW
jgi:hypothetical protein